MNVIVILADSLRVDHLGCYGNKWIKTPNLDRFAKEATVFERAYSEGLPTLPTRTAMFTGRYTFPFRGWQPLQPNDLPIAEILWSQGYKSALITDVYHMHKPGMAYERGFDFVQFIRGQEGDPLFFAHRPASRSALRPAVRPADGAKSPLTATGGQFVLALADGRLVAYPIP